MKAGHANQAVFSLLPAGKSRWSSFSAGFGIEILVLLFALWIPALFPQQLQVVRHYWTMPISAPPVVAWKAQPKPVALKRPEAERRRAEAAVVPPQPRLIQPVFTSPIAPRPVLKRNVQAPQLNEWARMTPTNADLPGSSAIPNLKRPRAPVQTGGFGDPDGLPPSSHMTQPVNIERVGEYDLPAGQGSGNGHGGKHGEAGVVSSAGFGNGMAISGNPRPGNAGSVHQGLFADERAANRTPRAAKTPVAAQQDPVVILYKPKPAYTAEAERLRIEGNVLLQVVFTASGEVNVLRVVQGLGHGLDESAIAAAREIRFRPARQDGRPVDSTAVVRIEFELAY